MRIDRRQGVTFGVPLDANGTRELCRPSAETVHREARWCPEEGWDGWSGSTARDIVHLEGVSCVRLRNVTGEPGSESASIVQMRQRSVIDDSIVFAVRARRRALYARRRLQ